MNAIELEQLKNDLATKIGVLEIKVNNGEITDETAVELINTYKEYQEKGTTLLELKLLYEDVKLYLS